MKKTDSLPDEISLDNKMARAVVDKIVSLDPITIEWIKQLVKQRYDAVFYEDKVKTCKDIFRTLLDNGIIDESAQITESGNIIFIEGQVVWVRDIIKLLEKQLITYCNIDDLLFP